MFRKPTASSRTEILKGVVLGAWCVLGACSTATTFDAPPYDEPPDLDGGSMVACEDCSAERTDGGFLCADGLDIPDEWVCDRVVDCAGGEDESTEACFPREDSGPDSLTSGADQGFECPDGSMIAVEYVCDGAGDCLGGEDELECEGDGGFKCEPFEGEVEDILDSWLCDGYADCHAGEDELNCLELPDGGLVPVDGGTDAAAGDASAGDGGTPEYDDLDASVRVRYD